MFISKRTVIVKTRTMQNCLFILAMLCIIDYASAGVEEESGQTSQQLLWLLNSTGTGQSFSIVRQSDLLLLLFFKKKENGYSQEAKFPVLSNPNIWCFICICIE